MNETLRKALVESGIVTEDQMRSAESHARSAGTSVEQSLVSLDFARFDDLGRVLFDQAALAAGDGLKDPAAYVRRLNKLLLELSA